MQFFRTQKFMFTIIILLTTPPNLQKKAGAIVRHEYRQGKGNVIRTMFREIDADCYIITDGDDTYPAEYAREMCNLVLQGKADMVIGDRLSTTYFEENKRPFHNFGNSLVRSFINAFWNRRKNSKKILDVMTGYRAFSPMFVKTVPILSQGYEIEHNNYFWGLEKFPKEVDNFTNIIMLMEAIYPTESGVLDSALVIEPGRRQLANLLFNERDFITALTDYNALADAFYNAIYSKLSMVEMKAIIPDSNADIWDAIKFLFSPQHNLPQGYTITQEIIDAEVFYKNIYALFILFMIFRMIKNKFKPHMNLNILIIFAFIAALPFVWYFIVIKHSIFIFSLCTENLQFLFWRFLVFLVSWD